MTVVSVQPTFYCNLKCSYCYLGNLRNKPKILNLEILDKRLKEILFNTEVTTIDIFGGEVSTLSKSYLEDLFITCLKYCDCINVTSNFSNLEILDTLEKYPQINFSLSWNEERPDCSRIEEILNNQNKYFCSQNNKQILTVALPSLLQKDPIEILNKFEKWKLPVTILRYFSSQKNAFYNLTTEDYENFLMKFIKQYISGNYTFPLNNLIELKNGKFFPTLNSNLFITPNGNYSWIDHFKNKEIYIETDDIQMWMQAISEEQIKYKKKCGKCPFFGFCLAEHLDFEDINEQYCCGLKNLMKWWIEEGAYLK